MLQLHDIKPVRKTGPSARIEHRFSMHSLLFVMYHRFRAEFSWAGFLPNTRPSTHFLPAHFRPEDTCTAAQQEARLAQAGCWRWHESSWWQAHGIERRRKSERRLNALVLLKKRIQGNYYLRSVFVCLIPGLPGPGHTKNSTSGGTRPGFIVSDWTSVGNLARLHSLFEIWR